MNPLPIPKELNVNEWFVILSIVATYPIFFLLKRNMPVSMMILIVLFSATIARITDHVLSGPPLDLYDVMDSANYDLFDILYYLLYGPFAYLFLYIYEKFVIKGVKLFLYIVALSILSVVYERITVWFGVFTFKEWRSVYSFPVYLLIQSLTIWYYRFLRKFIKTH
ncbi:hypothetical protein [Bacillus benzoevorans]|uniref:Uncharacterized protein n=1 Tax=Bacillus benzoevorans TaxID=1456 RepID=A0A7X0LVW9_9BACI|nr:hypothetical protein [Bacillus benzoevorans]MBB6446068.1 hypothetical protein [Bacillus benzoevorans]